MHCTTVKKTQQITETSTWFVLIHFVLYERDSGEVERAIYNMTHTALGKFMCRPWGVQPYSHPHTATDYGA
jgi:hypothetical protein